MFTTPEDIRNQFREYDKVSYIADRITKRLWFEGCTPTECSEILRIVEQRTLNKGVYEDLEYES